MRFSLRVWERGTGETRACGSAACAVLVAAARAGLSARAARVRLPGGDLVIAWGPDDHVLMTGDVELEFETALEAALLRRAGRVSAAVDIVTFGCRLNYVDSERLLREARAGARRRAHHRQYLRRDGRGDTPGAPDDPAPQPRASRGGDRRRRLRGAHRPESFAAMDGVARVIAEPHAAPTAESAAEGQTRAFLAVQNGCDHRCTFCIIPFGRGPSRSIAPAEVVAEARRLVDSGKREIVLTGVDLTSYAAAGRLARRARARRAARSCRSSSGCGSPRSTASRRTPSCSTAWAPSRA